jgi:D-glycero-D-manno-heptose 1,7-bisphosphate phosphatase
MNKAVFLDRDGVLNRSILINGVPKPPSRIEDIEILDGVIEAIQILRHYDYVPVVITNQPDVARGDTTQSQVQGINAYIGSATNIKHFYTCFHDDADMCDCRKPLPGLLYRATYDLNLSLKDSFMVGDRWRDIGAGNAAGCRSFFIDQSYDERRPELPYIRVDSLLSAAELITESFYGK